MVEKRFHADLYEGTAVDAAVKALSAWGTFEREQADGTWVIRVAANAGVDEERLADELANFALGLTIEASRSAPGAIG